MSAVATRPRGASRRVGNRPAALVLRAPGTNCDRETALALELAGARVGSIHLERLLAGEVVLDDVAMLVLPGGFSFGDHLGAGTLWAHRLEKLGEPLHRFVESGRPVLGICNGFQALLRLGLLEGGALGLNALGRFECRWVWMQRPAVARSPLLEGIERIAMPVAHGEGRFVASGPASLEALQERGQVALVYRDEAGREGAYPVNPNGSDGAVAALTNRVGNVLGMMPHPERNVAPGMAPAGRESGSGLAIFANAVRMARG